MTFRELFEDISEEAKTSVLAKLHEAMKWRGWDKSPNGTSGSKPHAVRIVNEIADIFLDEGYDIEIYT